MNNQDIVNDIKKLKNLSELSIKDISKEKGYADIVSQNLESTNSTQIRKFFNIIKTIEKEDKWADKEAEFYMLRPRMAASVGREIMNPEFYDVISAAMSKVDVGDDDEQKNKNFDVFVKFFESIIAYNKYNEKINKDNEFKKRNNTYNKNNRSNNNDYRKKRGFNKSRRR